MGPLGLFLLLAVALVAICVVLIRKASGRRQITDIDQDEPVTSESSIYRSQSYYPSSSATTDVLSSMLAAGNSASPYNGNGNSSVATATQEYDSPSSDEACSDEQDGSSSDCSSDSDSGSSYDSSSSDSGSSSDGGSSDSGSSD